MKYKIKSRRPHKSQLDLGIKLPKDYPWKVLGWLTDDLKPFLIESDFELLSMIIRLRDNYALELLSEEWGLQHIDPTKTGILEIKSRYVLTALLKKFRFDTDKALRRDKAKEKFLLAEECCRDFNREGYKAITCPGSEQFAEIFTYSRSFLSKLLGESLPSYEVLTEWSRHGPGANLDTCSGLVSIYHKYETWPYSCTIDAYRYARFAIESDQRWFGALQDSYRERNNIPKHFPICIKEFWASVLKVVDGNRIAFVPKNAKTERSIAIEPALNLYLQLGVDGYIRRRLKRYDVDLDDQTKNQRLAFQGSLKDDSKSFVTIDLAAASDTMSLKLMELLLPPDWYRYLVDLRSPSGSLDGKDLFYEKISSMGNGYTFALESSIFASAIFGVQKYLHGRIKPKSCAIFGDDLIVEKDIADMVITVLAKFGFTINAEKSFLSGPIRESCGTDWFQGNLIRPVFFEDTPSDVMELLTDINRLDRILSLRCGLEESKCVSLMEKWIPEVYKDLKGPLSDEEFDSYRHTPEPTGVYKNCLWKYKRVVKTPSALVANNFLFRKIMHDLRPTPVITQKWESGGEKIGRRFVVTRRIAGTASYSYSVADYWRSMYKD